jgi:hypothetical protein
MKEKMFQHSSVLVAGLLLAGPALAHQGDHTHFDLMGLIAHVFETDHIVFAIIAILTGVLAYRAGRRAEARAISQSKINKERGRDYR